MKAVILNRHRAHELVTVADPDPGPGEVLIRSHIVVAEWSRTARQWGIGGGSGRQSKST